MTNLIHFNTKDNINKNQNILIKYINSLMEYNSQDNEELFENQLIYFVNFLFRTTNLEKVLDEYLFYYKDIFKPIFFSRLTIFIPGTNVVNTFFEYLSNMIQGQYKLYPDKTSIPLYEFIFVTNINLDENSLTFFNFACEIFHEIKHVDENYLNSLPSKIFKNFEEFFENIKKENLLTFCISCKARSEWNAFKKINIINEKFFGYLSFVLYNGQKFMGKDTNLGFIDFSVNKFISIPKICFKKEKINYSIQDSRFGMDKLNLEDFKKKGIKLNEDNSQIENLRKYDKFLKEAKPKIRNKFFDYCNIYYAASKANNIHVSFLHFWAIMEQIIKMNGCFKDEIVKQRLSYFFENFLTSPIFDTCGLIDSLFFKRNNEVHEGKFDVNIFDRNVLKEIVDCMLNLFVYNSKDANSLKYFDDKVYKWPKSGENMDKNDLLKIYFDKELYLQNPPLSTSKFIKYCGQRGLNIKERDLEHLEKEGKFFPFFRVSNDLRRECQWYTSIQFSDEDSEDLKNRLSRGKIYNPENVEFVPYSTFRDKDNEGYKIDSYYSNFQFELLKEIKTNCLCEEFFKSYKNNRFNPVFQFLILIQDYMPYAKSNGKNIIIRNDSKRWHEKISKFDLEEIFKILNWNINDVLNVYHTLSLKAKALGSKDWIQLYENIDYNMEKGLKGEIRVNLDYLNYSLMVKKCIEDYLGKNIVGVYESSNISPKRLLEMKPEDLDRSDDLYYLSNKFGINYHPKIIIFVEGATEKIFLKEYFNLVYASIGNIGIDIMDIGGISNFFGKPLKIKNKDNKYAKKYIANYKFLISYILEKWQCLPYFLGDNENGIGQILDDADIMNYSNDDFKMTNDLIHLWKLNFELDNYTNEEISNAINQVLNLKINPEDIENLRKNNKSINALNNEISNKKIQINRCLFENVKTQLINENDNVLEKPIFNVIKKILDLANFNRPPNNPLINKNNKAFLKKIFKENDKILKNE
jgi:hypothetical protein